MHTETKGSRELLHFFCLFHICARGAIGPGSPAGCRCAWLDELVREARFRTYSKSASLAQNTDWSGSIACTMKVRIAK